MARLIHKFSEMLGLLSRGKFEARLDEELRGAIETLENAPSEKASAKLTVEITLSYQSGVLNVKPSVKCKLPDAAGFPDSVFWTHEGALSTQHPQQMDFEELRDVSTADSRAARA